MEAVGRRPRVRSHETRHGELGFQGPRTGGRFELEITLPGRRWWRDRMTLGSDGGFSEMESRVAKLEADVAHLTADVKDVRDILRQTSNNVSDMRERLSALEVKVDHLPSKDFVVKAFMGGFAAFVALSGFLTLFQGQIQHFFGVVR